MSVDNVSIVDGYFNKKDVNDTSKVDVEKELSATSKEYKLGDPCFLISSMYTTGICSRFRLDKSSEPVFFKFSTDVMSCVLSHEFIDTSFFRELPIIDCF